MILIPGSGRSLEEEMATHSSISCLENPMDRGAWKATVHGVAKSQTRLSDFTSLQRCFWRSDCQAVLAGESSPLGSAGGLPCSFLTGVGSPPRPN